MYIYTVDLSLRRCMQNLWLINKLEGKAGADTRVKRRKRKKAPVVPVLSKEERKQRLQSSKKLLPHPKASPASSGSHSHITNR